MKPIKLVLLTGLLCAALSGGYLASQAKDDKAEGALRAAVAAEARTGLAALGGAGGASGSTTMATRRVWAGADITGQVSTDGRFLSFTDWKAGGNVAVRDLATGESRPV